MSFGAVHGAAAIVCGLIISLMVWNTNLVGLNKVDIVFGSILFDSTPNFATVPLRYSVNV